MQSGRSCSVRYGTEGRCRSLLTTKDHRDVYCPHLFQYQIPGLSVASQHLWDPPRIFRPHQKGDSPTSLSSTDVSTTSLAATNIAKEWIAECTKSHPKCAQGKSSRLPTRLVDVLSLSKVGKVRIVETHSLSSDIQYVALSSRWDIKPTFRLTTSTREAPTSIVAIENLPRTIQDAINFTRNINLEWLRIDSLCIIQDSKEDWSRESLTMREVYQGSLITIAALGASSSEEGLFALRDPLLYSPCFLFQTKQGEDIYGGQDSRIACVLDDAWPLHQRGWLTQERILRSRTLKFGPYLIWECREKIIDEYNINAGIRPMGVFGMIGQFYDFVTSGRIHSTPTERDEAILRIWDELVVSYSQGALTVMTDRLVAISEIIVAIQKRTGWTNLAGLWEPFLWKQLLWRKSLDASREPTRLLPSCSWIAIDGGVYWARDERPSRGFFLNSVAHVKRIDNVTPLHMDENGTSDARMALQVSCMPARIGTPYSLQTRASKGPEGRLRTDLVDWPLAGRGIYQPDLLSTNRQPDLFLPIGAGFWNGIGLEVYGLAVSSSASCDGAFERVGLFIFHVDDKDKILRDQNYSVLHELSMKKNVLLV
jgi:hypothetical protein